MTIKEYADAHEFVSVDETELLKHFSLFRTFDRSYFETRNCLNCDGDEKEITKLQAGSWEHAKYCASCNSIVIIYEQDRMGGTFTDVIKVYKEKA